MKVIWLFFLAALASACDQKDTSSNTSKVYVVEAIVPRSEVKTFSKPGGPYRAGKIPYYGPNESTTVVEDVVYVALLNRFDSVAVFSVPFKTPLTWDVTSHFEVGDTVQVAWRHDVRELQIGRMSRLRKRNSPDSVVVNN